MSTFDFIVNGHVKVKDKINGHFMPKITVNNHVEVEVKVNARVKLKVTVNAILKAIALKGLGQRKRSSEGRVITP